MKYKRSSLWPLLAKAGVATSQRDDDPRCGMLNTSGHVKDGAAYSWMIQSLVIDSYPAAGPGFEPVATIRFLLSSPLLAPLPALCQGTAHSPEVEESQSCTHYDGTPMEDPWLSFSYSFLLEGFAQMNQTWTCERAGNKYVFSCAVQFSGEYLGWYTWLI